MNKDLLSGFDLSEKDIEKIFKLTFQLKNKKVSGLLPDKNIGLIFQKASMRTRVSFEVGMRQLGANGIFLSGQDIMLEKREPIKDIARVLSRYLDAIVARTFSHEHILEFARFSTIPVINGLSDLFHPCQALADIYTIFEKSGKFKNIKLAYIGDGNNVLHSLLAISSKVGLTLSIATPKGYEPQKDIWGEAQKMAKRTKSGIIHSYSPQEAVKDADYVYADVWTSMGQEKEKRKRQHDFKGFQLNTQLLKNTKKKYFVMHCMPVHRGEEITHEVMESKRSIIFDQAENRLHVQKAILVLLLNKNFKI